MDRLFANTEILMKAILRRDRIRIPVWLISIILSTLLIAAILPDLYPSDMERQIMAETMKNPAITVMLGPGYGLDNYTDGAMMAHFMLVFTALTMGIMGILLTNRHTGEEEEEGRIEMVRSLPVGSLSNLAATFLVLLISNIVLTLLTGLGLYSLGFDSMDLEGSLLYGASLGAVGIFFAALTGFFAQLAPNGRSTIGLSFAFLILAYLVRGIGDVGNEVLSLISPLGLILRTEVFVNNYWWPVLVTLLIAGLIFLVSLYLNSIRDLGDGFLPSRPGRNRASGFLSSPLGLTFRLQRSSIIYWLLGMLVLGASYGSVLGELEGFIESSEILKLMLPEAEGFNMTERFITTLISILTIIAIIPSLIFVLRLKSEERKNRTEQIYARAVSRNQVLGSYSLIAMIAGLLMQLSSILGLWSASILVMDDAMSLADLMKAGLVHLPAIWIFLSLAILFIGLAPRLSSLTWLYLGFTFFIVYLGDMLQLPEWMGKLTPFAYIPQLPIEELRIINLVILTGLGILLTGLGFIGYNNRNIEG